MMLMVDSHGFAMDLAELASLVGAKLLALDGIVKGVSTDTRTLLPGTLFIALRGKHFDGHTFVAEARERGAVAALVEYGVADPLPQIKVVDTRIALGQLAAYWRQRFKHPVVSITGSNGKTTVKEMVASILRQAGPVLATQGNLNNDIGVPLTLLQLDPCHCFAVVEMGANRPGEIGYLSQLVCPDVAVITNAAPAHLDGFGDLNGVVQAKGEIFQGIKPGGLAVLNADDPHVSEWRRRVGDAQLMSFGLAQPADITARNLVTDALGSRFLLVTPLGKTEIQSPLPGRHNVLNALAASTVAIALGLDLEPIKAALAALSSVPGRLQICQGWGGLRILNDTYNANPASLKVALDFLVKFPGEHSLVLGDFAELGEETIGLHRGMGEQARAAGVSRLYTVGYLSRFAAMAFGAGAEHFSEQQLLLAALRAEYRPGVTLLVKGSRRMRLEQLVTALCSKESS
jgi:UDP-N-acetylmuramoyl-tripeptide--D-alanyl-D-alanine ligase